MSDGDDGEVVVEVKKYLVSDDRGEFVIEIPAEGWKITFGYVNPAVRDDVGMAGRGRGHCLRIYEGKDKLRAVFGNVTGIRDLAIPLARKIEKQTGSSKWTQDSMGNFDGAQSVKVEFELEAGDEF
jgi:hypothetical protein